MVTAKERDFQKPEQFRSRCPQEGMDAMTVTAQILMDVFVTWNGWKEKSKQTNLEQ